MEQAISCQKMKFVTKDCIFAPLNGLEWLGSLRTRNLWFFGDYHAKQQYMAAKCSMWGSQKEAIYMGKHSGAEGHLFDNGVKLFYIPVGLHKEPLEVRGKHGVVDPELTKKMLEEQNPDTGLTREFMEQHGLSHLQADTFEAQEIAAGSIKGATGMRMMDEQLL
eukprot:8059630-Pyramimonas_sp.AAC.1